MNKINESKIPEDKNFNDFLVRDEQARIDNLRKYYSEIKPLINKLKETAKWRSSAQIAAIKIVAEIASELTFLIETLYLNNSTKELVEKVALSMRFFATTVDFNIPSNLQATKLTELAHGDKTRLGLTQLWQSKTRLKSSSKTEFDDLRSSMEGFIKAVENPTPTGNYFSDSCRTKGNEFDRLNFAYECSGLAGVDKKIRDLLLLPENISNSDLWGSCYVKWYKDLHPWPFVNSKNKARKPKSDEKIKNPLHQYAYERWLVRLKSSSSEHNVWLGFEIAVKERFRKSLACSDIKT